MLSASPETLHLHEACARAAFVNALAVRRQIERLRHVDSQDRFEGARRQADAESLLIALWRLRTAGAMCVEIVDSPGPVAQSLERFDAAFPHLKSARHVLMHYDNYLLENDKRRNVTSDAARLVERADVEALFNSPDGVAWLGAEYPLDLVTLESEELYRATVTALGTTGLS